MKYGPTTVALAFGVACSFLSISTTDVTAQITQGKPEVGGIYDEEKHHVDLKESNWRLGFGVGPSISTEANLINDFRAQERMYVRRQFGDLIQAEVGVGLHRLSGNDDTPQEFDANFWTFDGRLLIAPTINDQWNPYGFAGFGYSLYRVIDRAQDDINSEADVRTPQTGGAPVLPLGIGVQFKPERHSRIAIDMSLGYSMIFSNELDGMAGGNNASTINGMVSLEYLFHDVVDQIRGTAVN
ncbi:MAG: outer membrane beta-barrel protein [bacterium]|nr:outer membrane beta-barrel protein [Candidatus Kapabacteria bacterium]